MPSRSVALLLLATVLTPCVARSQEVARTRWSLSAGPTMLLPDTRPTMVEQFSACPSCTTSYEFISGARNGKYHAALGVSRELRGSALLIRGEGLVSRGVSSPQTYTYDRCSQYACTRRRNALHDDVFLVGGGLEWDAVPSGAVSPYLLTSLGWLFNRLQWSSDAASATPDRQADHAGIFLSAGAGVRVRVGKHEVFAEWRRYDAFGTPGSRLAPASLGFRF